MLAGSLISSCADQTGGAFSQIPSFDSKPEGKAVPPPAAQPQGEPAGAHNADSGPSAPSGGATSVAQSAPRLKFSASAPAEALSLEQVSIPAFIDEVYSKALKLNVQLDPKIASRTDLITLRTGRDLPQEELFNMAGKVLASYGIAVSWDGSLLHVLPDDALMAQMPDIIRGRALPDLPVPMRPVFEIVELRQVSATDMYGWLNNAYGNKIKIYQSPRTNSIMLFGLPENVREAAEAVTVLDRVRLSGQHNVRYSPTYWTADRLAAKVAQVLRTEGFNASSSDEGAAISLVPVEANNSIIVFAAGEDELAHVRRWFDDLDQPAKVDPLDNIYVYPVENTTAASLGQVLKSVLGGSNNTAGGATPAAGVPLEQSGQTQAASSPQPSGGGNQESALPNGTRVVIDPDRNALIIVGSAYEYQRIRPLLSSLDKPPREVLIEVTVAELTLTDSTNLGIEWSGPNNSVGGGLTQSFGTGPSTISASGSAVGGTGGLTLGTSGFNYTLLNGIGQVRFALNALSQNNHVSVLSTPRVLARSGGTASIDIGTQVPIVTSQATTSSVSVSGTSGILQSIQYQNTGVLMNVTPVVHSSDRIDLTVSQEVSAALPNTTSGISSPEIQNRDIKTQLSLKDGQTVVIGGLISETRTDDDNGVPFFKDIPWIGYLFRNRAVSRDKTELMVFITPYVISNDDDAQKITDQFRAQMDRWHTPDIRQLNLDTQLSQPGEMIKKQPQPQQPQAAQEQPEQPQQ